MVTRIAERRGHRGCKVSCGINIIRFVHLVSKGLFRHLKRRGNRVVIWCVNTREDLWEIHQQFGHEIDGVMTDNPTVLKKFMEEHAVNQV